MLKIINNLEPFFQDCYRRISVREYAKLIKISPPTASKILNSYCKEGLLIRSEDRNYLFFYANRENNQFRGLSKIYWQAQLKDLINFFEKNLMSPTLILFGSLAKAEVKIDSDIDLAVISPKKDLDLEKFENQLKRKIQVFWHKSFNDINNKELANNILNGYSLSGKLRI